MAENDIDIKIRIDDQGAVQVLDSLGNKLQDIPAKAKQAAGAFDWIDVAVGNLAAGAINRLLSGLAQIPAAIPAIIERGADIGDMAEAFEQLSGAAGKTADVFLKELQTATVSTISNFELMQKANQAMISGLSPDAFETATRAARIYSETTGQDLKSSIDDVTNAMVTGRDMMLKRIGITIDGAEAERKYAEAIGMAGQPLNEMGQLEAKRAAMIDALNKKLAETATPATDAADAIGQMRTALDNARDSLIKSLAENKTLNETLTTLADRISKIDWTPLNKGINWIIDNTPKAINLLRNLSVALPGVGGISAGGIKGLFGAGGGHGASGSWGEAPSGASGSWDEVTKSVNAAAKATEGAKKNVIDLNKVQEEGRKLKEKQLEQYEKELTASKKYAEKLTEQSTLLKKLNSPDGVEGYRDELLQLVNQYQSGVIPSVDQLTQRMMELSRAQEEAGMSAENMRLAEEAAKDAMTGDAAGGFEWGDLLPEVNDWETISDGLSSTIMNAASEGLRMGLSGETLKSSDWGALAGNVLGSFADLIVPGLGQIVNTLIEKVFDVFGGKDTPGTKARKEADKYFAEIFDAERLAVIIEGELVQVRDLVFKGQTLFGDSDFGSGTFDDFFHTLPDAAREAFAGVGLAFEELLGILEDAGGQLGAVFANNIGGSLNNLQILIEATGKSAEELSDAVIDAFLEGKVSALEAQSALNGIQKVFEKGIPDAIGATGEAWENFMAAGAKGGRVTVDAMQDMAYEAEELGLNFDQLEEDLKTKFPESIKEIQRYFQLLREHGIDTIEELQNATTEQLLPVISQMQSEELLPINETIDDINELIEKVNQIPNEIKKKLTYTVDVQYAGKAQEYVDEGGRFDIGVQEGQPA